MFTQAQLVTTIKSALGDNRMHGICLFIQDLLERKNPEVGVPKYRIKNKIGGADIKTVAEFIAAIDASYIEQSYPYQGERFSGDRVTGFNLMPMNLQVLFDNVSQEDNFYSPGGDFKYVLCFYVAYMNDGDSTVPMKVSGVRLLKV